ncbi:hypothetical protein [Intrasporangium flavum]|uniref:hypothetical protein n=1 Tax=Intrasporangium flavum TaxID=1428657 RepID=UPI00096F6FA0|nr:hypothetical protein [Intrasporangium flavum]
MRPTSFVVRALGRRVRVTLDASLLAEARRVWHLCLEDDADAPVDAEVLHDPPTPTTEGGPSERTTRVASLQELTQTITHAAIGAAAGELLMLHAGALCDPRTGATLMYAAPGGTGKTTVTSTFGPGRGYLTDETVGLTRDLTVLAYPKPLSVRRGDTAFLKHETAPGDLGLASPVVRPWLAGIVALRRDAAPGAPVEVEHVGLLEALVLLAPETSSLARLDEPLRRLADAVEAAGGLRVLHFADAPDLRPVVTEVLGRTR